MALWMILNWTKGWSRAWNFRWFECIGVWWLMIVHTAVVRCHCSRAGGSSMIEWWTDGLMWRSWAPIGEVGSLIFTLDALCWYVACPLMCVNTNSKIGGTRRAIACKSQLAGWRGWCDGQDTVVFISFFICILDISHSLFRIMQFIVNTFIFWMRVFRDVRKFICTRGVCMCVCVVMVLVYACLMLIKFIFGSWIFFFAFLRPFRIKIALYFMLK